MKKINQIALVFLAIVTIATSGCAEKKHDDKAVDKIVGDIETAMGGKKAYDAIKTLEWSFVGRKLYWNKWTADVRVENPKDNQVVLVNVNTMKGQAFENGTLVTDATKSAALLQSAKEWWINDSYWLVMPWKLQDKGVTLTYVKEDKLADGKEATILQMTFDGVGVTPENKYWIYVENDTHLIKQWAYYNNFNDEAPAFLKPWSDYKKIAGVLFSYDRMNEKVGPTNVIANKDYGPDFFTKL
ncbi:Holliday junction resolvase-like predicted endonuclease [Flavobacterium sp. 7E]|uniref:hypothetical protein n=1 Tax=unclassified Flavobacterium TaxID=196869 RepID=UPI00157005D5|nr:MULTISPECIES: hypothetical protein [unclassified Flavobacterium]NRS88819.1 Holliday junction resolvase-like predicted endonuclease [Flavobacterium sp. 7E]NRT15886.1 Holliday junction resolvase-like predicted endonuclease [Flavobacterium sp. 28A]